MKTRLALKVRAGTRKTEFSGKLGEAWKLHVAAPPVDGKANAAIVRFLAKLFAVPAASIRILTGLSAPLKMIEVDGRTPDHLERAILESNGHRSHPGSSAPREP